MRLLRAKIWPSFTRILSGVTSMPQWILLGDEKELEDLKEKQGSGLCQCMTV
jgi:hypothetical protein